MKQYGARGPLSDSPLLGEYVVVAAWEAEAAITAARADEREKAAQRVANVYPVGCGCPLEVVDKGYIADWCTTHRILRHAVAAARGEAS